MKAKASLIKQKEFKEQNQEKTKKAEAELGKMKAQKMAMKKAKM